MYESPSMKHAVCFRSASVLAPLLAFLPLHYAHGSGFDGEAAANLVRNGSFEAASNSTPDEWDVKIQGAWTAKVPCAQTVSLSADVTTGKTALLIDTTVLNHAAAK